MLISDRFTALFEQGYDSVIITSPVNRRYFTGFESSDGFLLVTPSDAVFFTDSRYTEAAENTITVCRTQRLEDAKKQLPEFLAACNAKKTALEAQRLTVSELNTLTQYFEGVELCADGALDKCINEQRIVKTQAEINSIIKAQRTAERAFEHILGYIRVGVSERDIALELEYFMLRDCAQAISFETIAVSGKNSSLPHGVPSDKKIEKGDFVTMDFGAVCDGLHSDMTRTVIAGEPDKKQREIYNTVLAAQNASLEQLRAGLSCFDADKAARDVITAAGYGEYFGHGTGHGVGLEIHEPYSLSRRSTDTLAAGHIVTVEPGIYLPGMYGVRIEDMALITEDGCQNLTECPKELIVL